MQFRLSIPAVLIAFVCVLIAPASAQIAITEFFPNPSGLADMDGEFIELFNYSTEPVNLNGWTVSDLDVDSDVISGSDLFVQPGGYIVLAKNKEALEGAFFGGLSNPAIIDFPNLILSNSGDELIITDQDQSLIWWVTYPNGEANGNSAFSSEDDFSLTNWDTQGVAGIDFVDIDPASITTDDPEGWLGYQSNNVTADPNATTTEEGDTASPLAGFYTIGGGGGPVMPAGFKILSIIPGAVAGTYDITFESEAAEIYNLESSSDLITFTPVLPVTSTGTETTTTVTPPGGATKVFYRIRKGAIVVVP